MKNRYNKNHLILIGLFLIFFIFEFYLWIATKGIPAMMENGESYAAHVTGKNFVKYGMIKLRFLEDYAMSSSKEAHPYYFTHNPDFPIFLTYALQRIGLTSISIQTFMGIFILALGLFYMYLTVRDYTADENAALFVLVLSVFSYVSVLSYAFNIHRVWTWLLIFGPLYHIKRYASHGAKYHLWISLIFYFLMTYYDYIYAAFLTFTILSLKAFRFYSNLSWRRLLLYILSGTIPSFLLHKIIVIWAIGPDIFLKDIYLTFGKRILGNVTMEGIEGFYASNSIVLWRAEHVKISMGYLCNFLASARLNLNWLFGEIYLYVLAIFFSACAISLPSGTKLLSRVHNRLRPVLPNFLIKDNNARLFLAFSGATILTTLVFHIYVRIFIKHSLPFFVFPVCIGGGALLSTLVTNIRSGVRNFISSSPLPQWQSRWQELSGIMACFILSAFIIVSLMEVNYRHLTKDVLIETLPGSQILHKYKGHSFITNYWDSYINYFTDEWVIMVWMSVGEDNVEEFFNNDEHLFEKDRFTNREKYRNPDFLFFYRKEKEAVGKNDPERIFKDYLLVEKGRDFWIFDLRKVKG